MAGSLVDPLVADPVRCPGLELIEVDRFVLGRAVQGDGYVDQAKGHGACPDSPRHRTSQILMCVLPTGRAVIPHRSAEVRAARSVTQEGFQHGRYFVRSA